MTTTPSALSTIETDVKKVISFGVSHLVLLSLLFISVTIGVYLFDSKRADLANAKYQAAESALATQVAQSTKDEAAYQQTLTQITAQNASLARSIAQRDSDLAKQKQIDATATVADTAKRLGGTVIDATNLDLPLDAARGLVASLDTLAATTVDLADETKTATNLQSELTAQGAVVTDLKSQLTDQATVCKAEVSAVKAQARKSKFHWFIAGVIAGVTLGHMAGF